MRNTDSLTNTPKQWPADPGERRNFDQWRQALWQTLDDYGWSVDLYEDTKSKMLFDCISEETGLTGHKSDRKRRRKLIKP